MGGIRLLLPRSASIFRSYFWYVVYHVYSHAGMKTSLFDLILVPFPIRKYVALSNGDVTHVIVLN